MVVAIQRHLARVRGVANQRGFARAWTSLNGAGVERASTNLDAAEVDLLRIAPDAYVCGQLPSLLVNAEVHLPKEDHRRRRLAEVAFGDKAKSHRRTLSPDERAVVIAATRGAYSAGRRKIMRLRSFRNVLLITATVLLVGAVVIAAVGALDPGALPLCFTPTQEQEVAVAPRPAPAPIPPQEPGATEEALEPSPEPGATDEASEPSPEPGATDDAPEPALTGTRARTLIVCPTNENELPPAQVADETSEDPGTPDVQPQGDGGRDAQDEEPQPATIPTQQALRDDAIRATAGRLDVALVAFVGLLAAGLSAATSLRQIRGTSTPYSLPVALALLKLPAGALTAVLGLLLMRGEFIPGLSALDSSAQILAWAVLLGYGQQLLTRYVDQRAQMILNVSGPGVKTREA